MLGGGGGASAAVGLARPGRRLLLGVLLALLGMAPGARAVMPTGKIEFKSTQGYTYCALASFGPLLPSKGKAPELLVVEPYAIGADNKDGCAPIVLPPWLDAAATPFALLLARGKCSFEAKAARAEAAGARLAIVYNNEEGLYFNRTTGVQPKLDYECANGQAWLPTVADPLWSPDNNAPACATDSKCASGRCLVTNVTDPALGTQVCCAWDVYMTMGTDPTVDPMPAISTVYVTMRDGDAIRRAMLATMTPQGTSGLVVAAYERPRPAINIASILIWLLGVATVTYASWNASRAGAKPSGAPAGGGRGSGREAELIAGGGQPAGGEAEEEEEVPALDLSIGHTVGFIVTASCFLILLFYVDLNKVIGVLYCISAGSAVSTIAARPIYRRWLLPRRLAAFPVINAPRWDIVIDLLDVLSTATGLGLGAWWLVVRDTASYAWVLQDILGVCLCVLFLTLVRFPNIKVATVLLVLAFLYDIFFVFLSPIFFHESVMIKVATGGSPKADETYCEKYPQDGDCQTREDLPMLLLLPRIGDYLVGFTMLGLGDIILPGLLVAFAARYDRANGTPLLRGNGYFRAMAVGYAVGLMMANVAVYLMQMGQPALLYLVPCTLGVFCLMAHHRGVLHEMWKGPPQLAPAPRRQQQQQQQPGDVAASAAAASGAEAPPVVLAIASPIEGGVGALQQPQLQQRAPAGRQEESPLLDMP